MLGLLSDVDVLTLNKEEMQQLVSGEDLEALVRRGLRLVPVVLVTDGVNGSIASDGKTIVRALMYDADRQLTELALEMRLRRDF